MRIEAFQNTIKKGDEFRYAINGCIKVSHPKGGCGSETCQCSPGHWISVIEPARDGIQQGVIFHFDNREELEAFRGRCKMAPELYNIMQKYYQHDLESLEEFQEYENSWNLFL